MRSDAAKEKITQYYRMGFWNKEQVQESVKRGIITKEDYEDICGEPFPET